MLFRRFYEHCRSTEKQEYPSADPARSIRICLEFSERFVLSKEVTSLCAYIAQDGDLSHLETENIFAPHPITWLETTDPDGQHSAAMWWVGEAETKSSTKGDLNLVVWEPKGQKEPTSISLSVDMDSQTKYKVEQIETKLPKEEIDRIGREIFLSFVGVCKLLAMTGTTVSHEVEFSKLNKQRARKGLYPLFSYREVKLNVSSTYSPPPRTIRDTGFMPLHNVRAHLRLLRSGKVVIVKAHKRGNPEYGIVHKHYTVHADGA